MWILKIELFLIKWKNVFLLKYVLIKGLRQNPGTSFGFDQSNARFYLSIITKILIK